MSERIVPGTRRELGTPMWLFARASGLVAGTATPALFRTLGKHRALFRGWLYFAGRLMPGGLLSRRETEIVILRRMPAVVRIRVRAPPANRPPGRAGGGGDRHGAGRAVRTGLDRP
ncbi:hypothetical protein [Amycolatopsis nigrescens]|uniref:hypothetical protein n=1 Tax=Amycolatopsis nigrescens TaxID=381445 RepID=UPI0003A0E2FC|nr:hypothetical protein [Amycolatopsis nigrescens]